MTSPPLGALAVSAGLLDARRLDALLRVQERRRAQGDVRWLGGLLVESLRLAPAAVRPLLRKQGLELVACELCATRYSVVGASSVARACPRCGRPLRLAPEDAPLGVEDTLDDGTPAGLALAEAQRGRTPPFGPYVLRGEVGRGGMGVIYKAFDPRRGRLVALKLIKRPEAAAAADRARFRREAQAIASLSHPHIVASTGMEEAEGFACIAMDYVPGVTLDVLLSRDVLPLPRVLWTVSRIARALHHAHGAGLIHRDVKPQNILVAREGGTPFLFDFGVAKSSQESSSLTGEGVTLGSLGFMAPEYLLDGPAGVTPLLDVYALGVILFLAACKEHPVGDPTADDFVPKLVSEGPRSLARLAPGLPPGVAATIDRACARDPARRHPSAAALADDLDRLLAGA